jgi:hypothetical protein
MGYWLLAMGYWLLAMGYWRWAIGDGRGVDLISRIGKKALEHKKSQETLAYIKKK